MLALPKNKIDRLLILSSIICWTVFLLLSYFRCSGVYHDWAFSDFGVIEVHPVKITFFLNLFLLSVFIFHRRKEQRVTEFNLRELIWSTFIVAACSFVGLAISILLMTLGRQEYFFPNEKSFIDFINNINVGFLSIFAAKAFYSFKRMILFQRTKTLYTTWNAFEGIVYTSLILNFFHIPITHPFAYISLSLFILFTIFLSLNMPWVAYLNVKQKWRSLLFLVLILLISLAFADYIYDEAEHFNNNKIHIHFLVNDLLQKPFIINTFIFIVAYSLTSILILIFNLPTSSVFEQKMGEVFSFQKLNQTIHTTDDVKHIYHVLLETSMSTTLSDSAWLEIIDPETRQVEYNAEQIDKNDALKIKLLAKENNLDYLRSPVLIKDVQKLSSRKNIFPSVKSILFIPLFFQEKHLGLLCLCKNVAQGFDDEIIEVISSFAGQASLSIENSRLMHHVIETERYKEEIKIARNVKQKLLSNDYRKNPHYDSSVFTNSADDVGGDYYAFFQLENDKSIVIIADVTGHGTSAAFNMAQLNGIVTNSIQNFTNHLDFISSINRSLSQCLDKKTFITLTSILIDGAQKSLNVVRAGHCPSLFVDKIKQNSTWIDEEQKTIGLGIIRNAEVKDHLEEIEHSFLPGDTLVLYTDGLIEAMDERGEDFGMERLKDGLIDNSKTTEHIVNHIIDHLHQFTHQTTISDDYTLIVLKFK